MIRHISVRKDYWIDHSTATLHLAKITPSQIKKLKVKWEYMMQQHSRVEVVFYNKVEQLEK